MIVEYGTMVAEEWGFYPHYVTGLNGAPCQYGSDNEHAWAVVILPGFWERNG